MSEYVTLEKCNRLFPRPCGSANIEVTTFNEIHGNRYVCKDCGFTCWGGKIKNKVKNDKRPPCPTPSELRIGYCQICLVSREYLLHGETLETHHIDDDPKNNDPLNLQVFCSQHHRLVHHIRKHYGEAYLKRLGVYDQVMDEIRTRG
jgi:predicted RNA-binding Zn-ribbon protein involved in translation (DUF1610 family)